VRPDFQHHLPQHRDFQQVDVFGATPFGGNPVAVVIDAGGLDDATMLHLARWTNLSETAFLLPPTTPEADYRVRIFTLERELPFAGHPTLGSCHAWLTTGGRPRVDDVVVQECAAGLVPIRRAADRLAFGAPPLVRTGPVDAALRERVVAALRVPEADIVDLAWVDNGPGWVGVLLADADAVLAVEPDPAAFGGPGHLDIGVVGPYPAGADCAIEVRAFFSGAHGDLTEDPVTGSLNASVAEWLLDAGRLHAPYVASQGTRLGRTGRVFIDRDDDGVISVGGSTFTAIKGRLSL
jgi:PhzF family phenazine biosynthesis protein